MLSLLHVRVFQYLLELSLEELTRYEMREIASSLQKSLPISLLYVSRCKVIILRRAIVNYILFSTLLVLVLNSRRFS